MIYKNLLYTGMLFVVLPVWFGLLWVWYLKIEGTVRKLCNAWVLGLASMFASGQILLVPMILGKRTLTEAVTLWKIFLVIVSIVIMVILIRRCGILVTVENKLENKKRKPEHGKSFWNSCSGADPFAGMDSVSLPAY